MEHQIFLSYSTKDAAFAEKLYAYLTGRGLACWMAPKSIAPGSEYGEAIIAGIEQAEVFVLVYSQHSNQSQHVLREVERCVNKNMPLIAYEVEQVQPTKSMEYFLMANQWMQAADAPEGHMEELYEAVMVQLKRREEANGNRNVAGTGQEIAGNGNVAEIGREIARNRNMAGTGQEIAGNGNVAEIGQEIARNGNMAGTGQEIARNGNMAGTGQEIAGNKNVAETGKQAHKQVQKSAGAPAETGKNAARRIRNRKAAALCVFLVAAVVLVFVCLRNTQTSRGGDVPDEAFGKLPGEDGNSMGNGAADFAKADAETDAGADAIQSAKNDVVDEKPDGAGTEKENNLPLSLKPGEYLTFGRYYPQGQENAEDAEINWIVLAVNEEESTALLLTEKIIDMKPYDVAESGVYGRGADGVAYDRTREEEYSASALSVFYGNSSWEYSNLRAWLNSSDGVVSYKGQEPVSKGTDDGVNGYQNQAGFLYDFTEDELGRLVVTQVETPANAIESASVTDDRVFLLSVEEAEMYLDAQKLSRYAAPTDAAIAASCGTIYPLYHSYSQETIPWYFRTPAADSAHEIMLCGSGFEGEGDVIVKYSCSAGSGVRPVIVVKLEEGELSGEGTRLHPYQISEE